MSDSEYMMKKRYITALDTDTSGTGVVLNYTAIGPVDVYRWGLVANSDLDVGSFAAELNVNQPAGASDVQVDTMTTTTDRNDGTILYSDLILPVAEASGEDSLETSYTQMPRSTFQAAPAGPVHLLPGDHVEIEITTAMTSGAATWFIEIVEHDFDIYATQSSGASIVNL